MVSTCGRGGCGSGGGCGGQGRHNTPKRMGRTQDSCYSLHDFPDKTSNISKFETI